MTVLCDLPGVTKKPLLKLNDDLCLAID